MTNITMERIDENLRVVLSDSGKVFINRNTNGTDLWFITFERGEVNKVLEGQYTTPTNAFEAVKNYLETNPNRIKLSKQANLKKD